MPFSHWTLFIFLFLASSSFINVSHRLQFPILDNLNLLLVFCLRSIPRFLLHIRSHPTSSTPKPNHNLSSRLDLYKPVLLLELKEVNHLLFKNKVHLVTVSVKIEMNTFTHVPPGFRFHPTDEELVDYYLRKKINSRRIDLDVIKDVDLYKIEPWDLQELCRLGTEEQHEWYFFSHKDKKYPTGTRTNRATTAGFWKATGRDKAIYSKHDLVGMRKTLVFYKGRAPNGQKSDWIMHEYRLETDENATTTQEEGWVVCRVFKKRLPTMRRTSEHESPIWYEDHQVSFMPEIDSPNQNNSLSHLVNPNYQYPYGTCKKELDQIQNYQITPDHFLQLPLLESPKLLPTCNASMPIYGINTNQSGVINYQSPSLTHDQNNNNSHSNQDQNVNNQVTDWRVLDKFVASQLLSQGDVVSTKENDHYTNMDDNSPILRSHDDQERSNSELITHQINKQELEMSRVPDQDASNSTSSCPIDLWK